MSEVTSISSEFDIFMQRAIQTIVLWTLQKVYKPLAPVVQNDLEFLIPGDSDTNIDLDLNLFVGGKMTSSSRKDVVLTDTKVVDNNLLHSLFCQYTIMINGVTVTQSQENYNYRA